MSRVRHWMSESFLPLLLVLAAIIGATLYLDRFAEAMATEPRVIHVKRGGGAAQVNEEGAQVSGDEYEVDDAAARHPAVLAARKAVQRGDTEGALAGLRAAAAKEAGSPVIHNEIAVILLRLDKPTEAIVALDTALALAPGYYRAHYNRGIALARLGRTDLALAAYARTSELMPTHFNAVYSRGLLLTRAGRLAEAETALRRSVGMASGVRRSRAYAGLGLALAKAKKTAEAAKAYQKAIQFQPDAVAPRYNLALLLVDQGGPAARLEVQQLLTQIKALQPGFAPAWFVEGRLASAAGDDKAAFEAYRTAARKDPTFWKAEKNAGVMALRLDRVDTAERIFKALAAKHPDRPELVFQLGRVAYVKRDFASAKRLYQKAIDASKGDYIEAEVNLGLSHRALGAYDDALAVFDGLIGKHPKDAGLHLNRALTLKRMKRWDDARAAIGRAIALRKNYTSAHYNLGKLEDAAGRPDAAAAAYRAALAINPDHRGSLINLGRLHADARRFDEAIQAYRAVIAKQPAYSRAHFNLGVALSKQDKYAEAAAAYRSVLELDPEHATARRYLGAALARAGQVDEGLSVFREALERSPADVETRLALAKTLKRLGRGAEAEAELRRCLKIDPTYIKGYGALASLLLASDRAAETVALLEPVATDAKGRGIVLARLGRAHFILGKHDAAREVLQRALKRRPRSVEVISSLAKTEAALGHYPEAVELVERGLKLKPKSALLRRRLKKYRKKL